MIFNLLSTSEKDDWIMSILTRCHIFQRRLPLNRKQRKAFSWHVSTLEHSCFVLIVIDYSLNKDSSLPRFLWRLKDHLKRIVVYITEMIYSFTWSITNYFTFISSRFILNCFYVDWLYTNSTTTIFKALLMNMKIISVSNWCLERRENKFVRIILETTSAIIPHCMYHKLLAGFVFHQVWSTVLKTGA